MTASPAVPATAGDAGFLVGREWTRWAHTATPAEIGDDINRWLTWIEAKEEGEARAARLAETERKRREWRESKAQRRALAKERRRSGL